MLFVFVCAFLCTIVADVNAASLFGKVIEVHSGDVITIVNLNRPVRVRLLGVDAPEMDQAFGDVAKKHLAYLVSDKSVLVEYAGIAGDHSLNGRVLLDGADIGAQMIRDGAAWVDPSTRHRLSATDREVYQQSEDAARSERRGLWQQENPLAPWEFVKAVALRRNPVAAMNTVAPVRTPGPDRPVPELTNLSLMASRSSIPPGRTLNSTDFADSVTSAGRGNWRLLRPARENFSAQVPEDGDIVTLPWGADRTVRVQAYRGRDGYSIFHVAWITAPTYGESDDFANRQNLMGFLEGFGQRYAMNFKPGMHPTFKCEPPEPTDISMAGYTGSDFDLSSCTIAGKFRTFTRTIDGERQLYFASVFYLEPDENVTRFINSFTITGAKPHKGTKAQNR